MKFESNSHSSFRIDYYSPNIQYSLDEETFIDYTPNEIIEFDDTLYIQWEGPLFIDATDGTLELHGENIKVSGRLLHGYAPCAYHRLFSHCQNMTDASELVLSSETVGEYAYSEMFAGCKQLTLVPELPATTLSKGCYSHMFYDCSSLTSVPELPATTLSPWCYYNMFSFCTSLKHVPNLIDTTAEFAYKEMFRGCTGLEEFLELNDEQLNSYTYSAIFKGCTPQVATFNLRTTSSVESTESTSIPPTNLLDTEDWLCITNIGGNGNYDYTDPAKIVLQEYNPVIYYSTDGETFTQYIANTEITITLGNSLYLKWEGPLRSYQIQTPFINFTQFIATNNKLSGRLLHGDCDYAYNFVFYNCDIVDASELLLAATTLGESCYRSLFYYTNVSSLPKFPATTLAKSCYQHMFYSSSTPNNVNQTIKLPATTLAPQCYYGMFWGYGEYREGNLKAEILATTLSTDCFEYMFNNCKILTYVRHSVIDWNSKNAEAWLYGAKSGGTVECFENSTIPTGSTSGIPTGWLKKTFTSTPIDLTTTEINYVLTNGYFTAYVSSSNNKVDTLTIPREIIHEGNTYLVDKLSRDSFANDNILKTLTIENGINTIEASALSGCNNLETIEIPESVSKIDNHAFWMCRSLKNIVLPSTLTTLKPEMFVDCVNLETITIPNGITIIPFRMFEGCKKLTTVNLPSTINKIQWSAFKDCESLTNITIPSGCNVDTTAFEGTNIKV